MQNLARDEAGNVWELDAQGNAVRVVQPAAPAASTGRVFSLAPNPRDVRRDQRQESRDAAADRDRAEDNAREERRLALAEEDARRRSGAAGGMTPQQQGQARIKLQGIDAIANQVARVEEALEAAQARGFVGPFYGRVPFSGSLDAESAVLDKAIAQLAPLIRQLTRTPGEGAMSDYESRLAAMALPSRSDNPAAIAEAIAGIKDLLGQSRTGYSRILGEDVEAGHSEQRADNEVVDPATGAQTRPTPDDTDPNPDRGGPIDRGPRREVATESGTTFDPRTSSQIDALINAGASKSVVDATLTRQGLTPISQGEWDAAQEWRRNNPGQRYFGANVSRQQDLSLLQKAAGAPVGAFLGHMGNMGSAGIIPAIMGPEAQGALDAASEANPNASFLGGVTGGVGGAMAMEGAMGRMLARAPDALRRHAPRIADTLYGGLTGFTTAREGEGGSGALLGAGAGLAGNLVGQGVTSGLGRLTRGVSDPNVRAVRDAGIPLSVGQVVQNSRAMGLPVGRAAKAVEDAATSIPFAGSAIEEGRRAGLAGFNQRMFREMPGHSGATGAAGVREAGPIVDAAYSFLDPLNLPLDAPYAGTNASIRADLPNLPAYGNEIGTVLNNLDTTSMGGALPGRDWQSAVSSVRGDRSSIAGQPFSNRAVDRLSDVEDNLMGLAARQGPPGTEQNLADANHTYGLYQTILKAIDNGPSQQADELVTPARLDAAARQGAANYGGRAASLAGDRPFYDLTRAARDVLPSQVPDSGTAMRVAVGTGLTGAAGGIGGYAGGPDGAATGAGAGLGTMLLLAAGGSRPAQRALTSLLADRPELLRQLGTGTINNSRYGGLLGAAAGTSLATQ